LDEEEDEEKIEREKNKKEIEEMVTNFLYNEKLFIHIFY